MISVSTGRTFRPPTNAGAFSGGTSSSSKTTGRCRRRLSYISDKNFLEEYYKSEFFAAKPEENFVYAEKQRDDWALTAIVQWRVNDFPTGYDSNSTTEGMPDLAAYKIGQAFADEKLTFFGEAHVGMVRWLPNVPTTIQGTDDFSPRTVARAEVNGPMHLGPVNVMPFGFARPGYWGQGTQSNDVTQLLAGGGVRAETQVWRSWDDVNSRLLDLDKMRHIVTPEATVFGASDSISPSKLYPLTYGIEPVNGFQAAEVGILQRWQTYRGPEDARRVVDVARLNVRADFFNDANIHTEPADGRLFWARPEDSITRNAINADSTVNISDSTSILGYANYDLEDDKFAIGDLSLSVVHDPRLAYHFGVRYIDDYDSAVGTFGFDYELNDKYRLQVFEQYDFPFMGGENLVTEVSIIRRFPRWYGALTFVVDRATENFGLVLSIWPERRARFRTGRPAPGHLGRQRDELICDF